jgi:hypothetical protein
MEEIKYRVEQAVMEEINIRIGKIVAIRSRQLQEERDALLGVMNVLTEEMESVNQENVSIAGRRDNLLKELEMERKWIRALEHLLKDNDITLPKYPN